MIKNIGMWIQAILVSLIVIFLIINFFIPVELIISILFILTSLNLPPCCWRLPLWEQAA